jgi:hypothetical protein
MKNLTRKTQWDKTMVKEKRVQAPIKYLFEMIKWKYLFNISYFSL